MVRFLATLEMTKDYYDKALLCRLPVIKNQPPQIPDQVRNDDGVV